MDTGPNRPWQLQVTLSSQPLLEPVISPPQPPGFGKDEDKEKKQQQQEKGELKRKPCEEQQKGERMVSLLYAHWARRAQKRGLCSSQEDPGAAVRPRSELLLAGGWQVPGEGGLALLREWRAQGEAAGPLHCASRAL